MLTDKKVRTIVHLLLVHAINGCFSLLSSLERDVSLVLESVVGLTSSLDVSRYDFTELREHRGQFVVVSAGR